ncbi:hypothetical protein FJ250_00345 [bacterium]|nr:hypothetical protein [bacterium]
MGLGQPAGRTGTPAGGGKWEQAVVVIVSSTLITLALVFYTVGVWAERLARYLKPWHVVAFWVGFVFDVGGTRGAHGGSR